MQAKTKRGERVKPSLPVKPKRGRGKPRRAPSPAPVNSVRVDDSTKAVLTREFGSLGNALFYLAQGIEEFRAAYGLPPHKEKVKPRDEAISPKEMKILLDALDWRLDYCIDRRESQPFLALRQKLAYWSRKRPKPF